MIASNEGREMALYHRCRHPRQRKHEAILDPQVEHLDEQLVEHPILQSLTTKCPLYRLAVHVYEDLRSPAGRRRRNRMCVISHC